MKTISVALLAIIALAATLAAAETNPDARVPASEAVVTQKALLVENMAYRSVSARTIEESGDAEAIAALEAARNMIEDANEKGAAGDFEAADDALDLALGLINQHARRLSLGAAEGDQAATLYQRRRSAVGAFIESYKRVAAETGVDEPAPAEIEDKVARADGLADEGDHVAALVLLDEAYETARSFIRTMRDGQTLTRSLIFETAKEEYDYELKRNDSHFALLEFAIAEKAPQGSVVERIAENRTEATQVRAAAEGLAADGDFPAAIGSLNQSTELLLKAIRMSGIFIPG